MWARGIAGLVLLILGVLWILQGAKCRSRFLHVRSQPVRSVGCCRVRPWAGSIGLGR